MLVASALEPHKVQARMRHARLAETLATWKFPRECALAAVHWARLSAPLSSSLGGELLACPETTARPATLPRLWTACAVSACFGYAVSPPASTTEREGRPLMAITDHRGSASRAHRSSGRAAPPHCRPPRTAR
ncbi:hypothetical protein TPA0910_32670 [Streptomyces hygroscopicus subsp. sporocinereus]|uniref:Uncharacterized protein n=1 Tax=Streptomyces hygroscopicus TaxID=1912 RepID=A0ABQ3TZN3_STRHY|nr:hypothetical protein TPA0910_32670 [Streptomyces hygroscopicus]